jgi:hypothetical protein
MKMTKTPAVVALVLITSFLTLNQPSFAQGASNPAPSAPAAQTPATPIAPPPEAPPAPHGRGIVAATILSIHGRVASVNRAKKTVTLLGPGGNQVTVKVANPANLASVKPGDAFVARFFESVHVRRKRPGEVLPAVSVKEGITTATPGEAPGGVIHTKRKVVLNVAAIDPKDGTVTVKGPDGSEETVKVGNSKYLSHIKVGDDLVVTERQAIAISLEKE